MTECSRLPNRSRYRLAGVGRSVGTSLNSLTALQPAVEVCPCAWRMQGQVCSLTAELQEAQGAAAQTPDRCRTAAKALQEEADRWVCSRRLLC